MPVMRKNDLYDDEPETKNHKGAAALLPKDVVKGHAVSVGDKIILEVTGIADDSFTVAYADAEPAEPAEPAEAPGEMAPPAAEDNDLYA
jgi:hypothetical protein